MTGPLTEKIGRRVKLAAWLVVDRLSPGFLVHVVDSRAQPILVGFVITFTHLYVLMTVKTSARSWKDCSALELMLRHYLKIEVSVVFTVGFIVFLVHLTCFLYVIFDPALSLLFAHGYFVL